MKFFKSSEDIRLHIPLCPICGKPLFEADHKEALAEFEDPLLKRNVGLVHEVCKDMQMYVIGMNSHLISAERAEA